MTRPFESLVGVGIDSSECSMYGILAAALALREEGLCDVIGSTLTADQLVNTDRYVEGTGNLVAWTGKYVYCNLNDWEHDPYVISIPRNPPQTLEGANANG